MNAQNSGFWHRCTSYMYSNPGSTDGQLSQCATLRDYRPSDVEAVVNGPQLDRAHQLRRDHWLCASSRVVLSISQWSRRFCTTTTFDLSQDTPSGPHRDDGNVLKNGSCLKRKNADEPKFDILISTPELPDQRSGSVPSG